MLRRTFSIDSNLSLIADLAESLAAACDEIGICRGDTTVVELCAIEALNNAIEHAYGGRPGDPVEVVLTLHGVDLAIEVRDFGTPMPEGRLDGARASMLIPEDLASLPERNRGLAILQQAMDEVTYTSARGANTLRLFKRVTLTNS